MAEVKKPQDRKPKTVTPKTVETDTGWDVTLNGVTIHVDRDVMDDFELLDDLAEVENGNAVRLPSLFRRLAGDQAGEALNAIRNEKGRVPIEAGATFVGEVLTALNPNS